MKFEKTYHSLYSMGAMLRRLDDADKNTEKACCGLYSLSRELDELSCLLHHCSESGDPLEKAVKDLESAKKSVYEAYQSVRKVYKPISDTKNILLK